jgi:hypothetical protein
MRPVELPEIPLIDARAGGTFDIMRGAPAQLQDLVRTAHRLFRPPLLVIGDGIARRWPRRNASPYLREIDAIAADLPGSGAYALNTSYEWCCTSGVGDDPAGGIRLVRVLDWAQPGLGRNVVLGWQRGAAGDFVNITWPGFVGVLTAMAPGRFAAALNQPPMPTRGLPLPIDWILSRPPVWRSAALPPAHLLRLVCETCRDYEEAKRRLAASPLCIAALFVLAGTGPGEGCVIERTPDAVAVRDMPAATANHWVVLNERGRPPAWLSAERQCRMEEVLHGIADWRAEPIVNYYTRVATVMNPALASLSVEGWEEGMPATAPRELRLTP